MVRLQTYYSAPLNACFYILWAVFITLFCQISEHYFEPETACMGFPVELTRIPIKRCLTCLTLSLPWIILDVYTQMSHLPSETNISLKKGISSFYVHANTSVLTFCDVCIGFEREMWSHLWCGTCWPLGVLQIISGTLVRFCSIRDNKYRLSISICVLCCLHFILAHFYLK